MKSELIEITHLCDEGVTLGFLAKGNVPTDAMKEACLNQYSPSQYEDEVPNLKMATICRGAYRWVPMRDEYGDYCGMQLIPAKEGSRGSFFATELILN